MRYAQKKQIACLKALADEQSGKGRIYLNPEFADPYDVASTQEQDALRRRGVAEIDQLERALAQRVLWLLVRGELRAAGQKTPISLTPAYEEIAPETWSELRADFRDSSATADGLKIVGIRVLHQDDLGVPLPSTNVAKSPSGEDQKRHTAALEAVERRAAAADPSNPECPVCGKRFELKTLRQKNCSRKCTERASKERREKAKTGPRATHRPPIDHP